MADKMKRAARADIGHSGPCGFCQQDYKCQNCGPAPKDRKAFRRRSRRRLKHADRITYKGAS